MKKLATAVAIAAALMMTACAGKDGDNDSGAGRASSSASGSAVDKASSLVSKASQGQAQLFKLLNDKDYLRGGLIPVLVRAPGAPDTASPQVVWITADYKYILPTEPLSENGGGLNKEILVKSGFMKDPTDLDSQIASSGFVDGKSGPVITSFMDPNCVHCHSFYEAVSPLVASGKVRVRYLMVGFLRPSSVPLSANILASKDPAAELKRVEDSYKKRAGGDDPLPEVKDQSKVGVVQQNAELLGKLGDVATPALVYCLKEGDGLTFVNGGMSPEGLAQLITKLDGNSKHASCK